MANWNIPVKIPRRVTGAPLVPGTAPLTMGIGGLGAGQLIYDSVSNVLWIGAGDDGSGNSTAIMPISDIAPVRLSSWLLMN